MNNLFKKVFTVSVVVTTIFWSMGLAALVAVPVATAATLTDGDLIKGASSAVYYYMGGKKYVFTSEAVYKTWFANFSNVKTLTADEMSALSIGGNVAVKAGTKLVQFVSVNDNGSFVASDPKVYVVSPNGVLHHLDSATRAVALYGSNWESRIQPIVDGYFVNYTVGSGIDSNVHPEGTLIKYAGSDNNYVIQGGMKRLIASGDVFVANGFQSSNVVTTTITYSDGTNLTGAEALYTNAAQTGTATPVTPATGGLTVSLSSATPAAATVPANATSAAADYVMTKVNLTAGASDVTVTAVKVTRAGLGNDAAFDALKLFDGTLQVGTSQTLGSSHQASFAGLALLIPAGQTKVLSLAATFDNVTTYSGNILNLGINVATDITTTAVVAGTFPVTGNSVTLSSSVDIGSATLYNGSLGTRNSSDLTVDPTTKDVRLTQVKIAAGSAEGLVVDQLVAVKNGTAATTDVSNIRLVNDNTGKTLATLQNLNSAGRAVFDNLGVSIDKGGYVELSLLVDMVGGAGRTISFDLHDGVAYTIKVHGAYYGYGITPTRNNFCAAAGTCFAQTINQGYLSVAKSAKTPATGSIALGGTGVTLAAFDFTAYGEAINVSKMYLTVTPASGGSAVDYSNVTLYDANGVAVAGPKDGSTTGANTAQYLSFTDAFTIPQGTNTYYVRANVSSSAVAGEKVTVGVTESTTNGGITAKGASSGKTTYTTSSGLTVPPGASDISANQMTIQGPVLKVVTLAAPIAGDMVVNAQDQVLANIQLDASQSGEDLKVTSVYIKDTFGAAHATPGIARLELWGDADNTDTDNTAKRIETTNSTDALTIYTTDNSYGYLTFTLKTPMRIKKGTQPIFSVKADLTTVNGTSHTIAIPDATNNVVATGWSGSTCATTYSGSGQAQTVQASGLLKINTAADRTSAAQYVAGTTGNSMMSYKLQGMYEPIDVTTLYVATTGATAKSNIAKVKLYVDGKQIGVVDGYSLDNGGDATVVLDSGTLVVPQSPSYSTLTIKVDLSTKADLADASTLEIGLGTGVAYDDTEWGSNGAASTANSCTGGDSDNYCYYYMAATGKNSGVALTTSTINSTGVNSTGTVSASYVEYLYDGVLVVGEPDVALASFQTPGTAKEVFRFKLTAVGDTIVINELEFTQGGTCDPTGTQNVYIKDINDVVYATLTSAGQFSGAAPLDEGTWSVGDSSNTDTFDTGMTITVEPNTSETYKIVGDTVGCTSNESLQFSLAAPASSNKTAAGVEWENSNGNDVDSALTKNLPFAGVSLGY